MQSTVLLGLQWGDEGKGKIIDVITHDYDAVVRFQGGNNAGHTIVHAGRTYKLNHIPSGILHEGKTAILGAGMVIELEALFAEIAHLRENGVDISGDNLRISDNATLLLPFYKNVDTLLETERGDRKIGTTGKGIGIAYQDRVGRRALRMIDIYEQDDILQARVREIVDYHAPVFVRHEQAAPSVEEVMAFLRSFQEQMKEYITSEHELFNKVSVKDKDKGKDAERHAYKHILFEGAQGVMLDATWGTYPYVTSSNTHVAEVFIGSGLPFKQLHGVLGVLKAYTTRVGSGALCTEDVETFGSVLQEKGAEFGTVTGRKRRCGALDLVAALHATKLCGVTELAITKLDVLSTLENIPICIAYDLDGKQIHHVPLLESERARLKPIYAYFKGWNKDITQIKKYDKLPEEAKAYVEFIASILRVRLAIISVGADRDQTIIIPPHTVQH